jgi:hypothetical protein
MKVELLLVIEENPEEFATRFKGRSRKDMIRAVKKAINAIPGFRFVRLSGTAIGSPWNLKDPDPDWKLL